MKPCFSVKINIGCRSQMSEMNFLYLCQKKCNKTKSIEIIGKLKLNVSCLDGKEIIEIISNFYKQ